MRGEVVVDVSAKRCCLHEEMLCARGSSVIDLQNTCIDSWSNSKARRKIYVTCGVENKFSLIANRNN